MTKKLLIVFALLPILLFSEEKQPKGKVNYAFIPIVGYNNETGAQYGAMASSYFNLSSKDTISPASNIGLLGSYYSNDTYLSILYSKMYFKEDNYRMKSAIGFANINFQTFVDIELPEEFFVHDGDKSIVEYNTKSYFAYVEGTKKIYKNLYLGARFIYTNRSTNFDVPETPQEKVHLFGFGIASEFDSRDNVFNPQKGQNSKINTFTFLEDLGSSNQYSKVAIQYNKYMDVSSNVIIALRSFGIISFGDVPFSGKNVVSKDDMRGYTKGEYRANQVYDLQSELRWNVVGKWGVVLFGGVAVATDDFKGNNYSGLLPAIGTGIRFKAIKSRNINVGIDVAKGRDDWGIYFRIGEAFGR